MIQSPSYYRARISTFLHFISNGSESKEKTSPNELLKYGVIHPDLSNEFESYLAKVYADYTFSETPLSFSELSSFNTWFAMYPEKIAGKETITTSREFPIGIKGSKEDVIRVIGGNDNKNKDNTNNDNDNKKDQRIRIAKAKAQAKIKLLNLIKKP
jgi:hypothetical protein